MERWQRPSTALSWCHGEAGIRLQSPSSSRPFNPFSSCVIWHINSCRTCNEHIILGFPRYKSSRFDTIHPVSVPIRYLSDDHPFSKRNYMECADRRCSWYYGKLTNVYNHWSSVWYIYETRAHISLSGTRSSRGTWTPGYPLTVLVTDFVFVYCFMLFFIVFLSCCH